MIQTLNRGKVFYKSTKFNQCFSWPFFPVFTSNSKEKLKKFLSKAESLRHQKLINPNPDYIC
jgi:hypothetical protein